MDHGDIRSKQLDGFLEDLFPVVHVVQIKHVHGIKENLEVMGADLIQSLSAPLRSPDDVSCNGFDRKGDAVLLGTSDYRLKLLQEEGESRIGTAFRAVFVFHIGSTSFGTDHSAA